MQHLKSLLTIWLLGLPIIRDEVELLNCQITNLVKTIKLMNQEPSVSNKHYTFTGDDSNGFKVINFKEGNKND